MPYWRSPFTINNGDTASASYLTSMVQVSGYASAASVLIGNATTAASQSLTEITIGSNLSLSTLGVLNTSSAISVQTATVTGNIFAGTTNTDPSPLRLGFDGSTARGISIEESSGTSGAAYIQFRKSGGTTIGSITRNGTSDAVLYNLTSDDRLKTNIRDFPASEAGRLIDGLRPRMFDWKSGDKDAIGFIAQEENAADPAFARIGAVTVGDDDPDTIHKQWLRSDQALVPILVAELKSLRARVAQLEAKP